MDIRKSLVEKAKLYSININEEQAEKFNAYAEILVEWNEKMNLTTIIEPEDIVIKHFIDSLLLVKSCEIRPFDRVIDVGTGAGFPGVALKILEPDIKLTLLDGANKRLVFLEEVAKQLDFDVNLVHGRAEEKARDPYMRDSFDISTARAVANMNTLTEFCLPFVKIGGLFVALKGREIKEELDAADKAIFLLGGKLIKVDEYTLPDESKRTICVIEKTKPTPSKYPRNGGKIKKEPLI